MESKGGGVLYDTARAQRLMGEAGIDLLLASRRANVAFLTDSFNILYWQYPDVAHCLEVEDDGCGAPFYFAGVPRDAGTAPFAVAHANRSYVFDEGGCVSDVRKWCDRGGQSRADVIAEAIRQRKLDAAVIGVEMDHLPAALIEALRKHLPKARFVDAEKILWRLRAVKTERALERQHQAYRIGEDVYREVLATVQKRAGQVTVGEIRAMQMAIATRAGCPPLHFGYVFPQSPTKRAWDMSADWRSQTIDRGDVLLLDLGLIWHGYTTDFGRNAVVGRASAEVRDAYAKTVECRQQVAALLRPGVGVRDAFAAACKVRERLGLPPRESFGHGLGIECHEHPILSGVDDDGELEEGMTIVIELVEHAGPIAFLLEDAGLITPRGWESMTRMGTELVEL